MVRYCPEVEKRERLREKLGMFTRKRTELPQQEEKAPETISPNRYTHKPK